MLCLEIQSNMGVYKVDWWGDYKCFGEGPERDNVSPFNNLV